MQKRKHLLLLAAAGNVACTAFAAYSAYTAYTPYTAYTACTSGAVEHSRGRLRRFAYSHWQSGLHPLHLPQWGERSWG